MPGAIAAVTFCESLADASVAAADAAFASLYDGMQKNETGYTPEVCHQIEVVFHQKGCFGGETASGAYGRDTIVSDG